MGRRQAEVQLAADFGEQAGANPRCLILFCPPFPATDVEETQKALRRSHLTQGLEASPMWRPLRCRDPESQDIGRSRARSRVNTALGMERYWHYPESPALEQFLGETQPREWGQARSAQVPEQQRLGSRGQARRKLCWVPGPRHKADTDQVQCPKEGMAAGDTTPSRLTTKRVRSYLIKILKYKEVPCTGNKGLLGAENAASVHCARIHQARTLAIVHLCGCYTSMERQT